MGCSSGVTVGLVGSWGAPMGSRGAWEGHGALMWGHGGAHRGSWGTCGAMGRLVELCDAHVMSWGAWWGHRVLIWSPGVLLWGHEGLGRDVGVRSGPRWGSAGVMRYLWGHGALGGLWGVQWSHGGLGGVMGCLCGVTRSLGGTWGACVGAHEGLWGVLVGPQDAHGGHERPHVEPWGALVRLWGARDVQVQPWDAYVGPLGTQWGYRVHVWGQEGLAWGSGAFDGDTGQ